MKNLFIKRFQYYKELGDKTFSQLPEEAFFWQYNEESNAIAVIVKHIAGNMLSRWTNFLTEDGEKDWRNRDAEFINNFTTEKEVKDYWEKGWKCLFDALELINEENLLSTVYIRGEAHTVLYAVLRQLAHYPYHIGQIVYIAKMLKNSSWESLSIPRDKSAEYNIEMLNKQASEDIPENASPVCYANLPEVRDEFKS